MGLNPSISGRRIASLFPELPFERSIILEDVIRIEIEKYIKAQEKQILESVKV